MGSNSSTSGTGGSSGSIAQNRPTEAMGLPDCNK
jgi:hypothetical protein